jgi:homogentisate 1,2-dioxygenase
VAWHGNYTPYKYNLENFMVINSVAFDHAVSLDHVGSVGMKQPSGKRGPQLAFGIYRPNISKSSLGRPRYTHLSFTEGINNSW